MGDSKVVVYGRTSRVSRLVTLNISAATLMSARGQLSFDWVLLESILYMFSASLVSGLTGFKILYCKLLFRRIFQYNGNLVLKQY